MDEIQRTIDEQPGIIPLAVKHGLLNEDTAHQITVHASESNLSASDAAISLSILTANQIDALRHLQNPTGLSPDYSLIGLIGIGASGIVFRATQSKMNRDVALKTINAARMIDSVSLKRIQREAAVVAQLSHPNIVTAYDCGFHDGQFYIAMELIEGQDLLGYIAQRGKLAETECWLIVRQVAAALAYASEQGLIHRDIKPANVLVTDRQAGTQLPEGLPLCKVVDFGLAYQEARTDVSKLTVEGNTLGTPAYVAPEQLMDSSVDLRADIYALGATAFHILTGQAPFSSHSVIQTITKKMTNDDEWRDQLPAGFSPESVQLFLDMTESKADDRIQTYEQLFQRIDEITSGVGAGVSFKRRANGAKRNSSTKKILGVAAALLIIIAGWFVYQKLRGASNVVATSTVSPIDYVRTGQSVYLFDGKNAPIYKQSGLWIPKIGVEGGTLKGQADSWIDFPLSHDGLAAENTELEIGCIISDGATASVQLPPDRDGMQWAIRLGNDSVQLVSVADETKTLGETISIGASDKVNHSIMRIQLLEIGDQLTALFRGKPLATIECSSLQDAMVRVMVQGGDVELADIMLTGLVPPDA